MAAPPPPPPPPVPLADLHEDIQLLILRRIPCSIDRGRMSLVCRAWRNMMRLLQRPRELPWLLLPPPAPFAAGPTRAACVMCGFRVHHLALAPPGARCFGSHEGGWLFLRSPEALLLNVRTGNARALPTMLQNPQDDPRARNMVFLAAVLSAPPEDPLCVIGALLSSRIDEEDPAPAAAVPRPLLLRQCRMALYVWERPDALHINSADFVEDVAYHDGAFCFLTAMEALRVVKPVRNIHGHIDVQQEMRLFDPIDQTRYGNNTIHARYLVASHDELLMVVRIGPDSEMLPTSSFKVFLATKLKKLVSEAKFPHGICTWAWNELDTLGGRMLFVGRGCSRSYLADDYPGFKEGVYFLDDGKISSSDNGMWSDGQVQHCFPRTDPSDHSAPIWILP